MQPSSVSVTNAAARGPGVPSSARLKTCGRGAPSESATRRFQIPARCASRPSGEHDAHPRERGEPAGGVQRAHPHGARERLEVRDRQRDAEQQRQQHQRRLGDQVERDLARRWDLERLERFALVLVDAVGPRDVVERGGARERLRVGRAEVEQHPLEPERADRQRGDHVQREPEHEHRSDAAGRVELARRLDQPVGVDRQHARDRAPQRRLASVSGSGASAFATLATHRAEDHRDREPDDERLTGPARVPARMVDGGELARSVATHRGVARGTRA